MLNRIFTFVILIGTALTTQAETNFQDPFWQDIPLDVINLCKKADILSPPATDLPTPEQIASLKDCSSDTYYYGLKQMADAEKARLCAFAMKDNDVLTMIYANGRGAGRNLDLAIKFACTASGAPAEITGRVQHLSKLKNSGWQGNNFDICDDITSGYMMGYCASIDTIFAEQKRQKQMSDITNTWSDADQQKFQILLAASKNFISARTTNEIDLSGTARMALQFGEENKLNNDFIADLKRFQEGLYPKFSEAENAAADAKLNSIYSKIQSNINFSYGTVTKTGIKETEKSWINYRDAWVAFAKEKYPQMSMDSLKTWLTLRRIDMLEEFSSGN
jgi:uncharacterized protein YecT (DUF1311 family)